MILSSRPTRASTWPRRWSICRPSASAGRRPGPDRQVHHHALLHFRVRGSQFRMHYQYVMANDRRAPYDYFMLVCGPVSAAEWAVDPDAVVKRFGERAAYPAAEVREARAL